MPCISFVWQHLSFAKKKTGQAGRLG
eukprot:COSAG06_NODE_66926_length_253_cov_0.668831_1_plen_25_part_10